MITLAFTLTTACVASSRESTPLSSEAETLAQATTLSEGTLQPEPSSFPSADGALQTSNPPSPAPSRSVPGEAVRVIERGDLLRVYGFSPNNKLLAYWTSINAPPIGFDDPAGQIKFLDVATGRVCIHSGVAGYRSQLAWREDDKVVIVGRDSATVGAPCGEDTAEIALPKNALGDKAVSVAPGGYYQAETILRSDNDDGTENRETRINDLATGRTVNFVSWKIDVRVRGPGEGISLGGQWIAPDKFLIFETIDEGPLLIGVGGEVIRIASELFGLQTTASAQFTFAARGASVRSKQKYYIVLFGGSGIEAAFPPARLFHSDTREVETLPFKRVWEPAFSPDGQWLLLAERPRGEDGREDYALWIRSVDPKGSQPRELARGDSPGALWSHDWTQVAFGGSPQLAVLSFPDGFEMGTWDMGNYTAIPRAWSLDNRLLAVEGYVPGKPDQALFLIAIR